MYSTNFNDDRRTSILSSLVILSYLKDSCTSPEKALTSREISKKLAYMPGFEWPISERSVRRILDKLLALQESSDAYEQQLLKRFIFDNFHGTICTIGNLHKRYWFLLA